MSDDYGIALVALAGRGLLELLSVVFVIMILLAIVSCWGGK